MELGRFVGVNVMLPCSRPMGMFQKVLKFVRIDTSVQEKLGHVDAGDNVSIAWVVGPAAFINEQIHESLNRGSVRIFKSSAGRLYDRGDYMMNSIDWDSRKWNFARIPTQTNDFDTWFRKLMVTKDLLAVTDETVENAETAGNAVTVENVVTIENAMTVENSANVKTLENIEITATVVTAATSMTDENAMDEHKLGSHSMAESNDSHAILIDKIRAFKRPLPSIEVDHPMSALFHEWGIEVTPPEWIRDAAEAQRARLNGQRVFRSRAECEQFAFLSRFFGYVGYEQATFDMVVDHRHTTYQPDFWVPALNMWIECKAAFPSDAELGKCMALHALGHKIIVMCGYAQMPIRVQRPSHTSDWTPELPGLKCISFKTVDDHVELDATDLIWCWVDGGIVLKRRLRLDDVSSTHATLTRTYDEIQSMCRRRPSQ
jgi:hypothetical protein